MKKRLKTIIHEFEHHFPFTILAVVIAVLALGIFTELVPQPAGTGTGAVAAAATGAATGVAADGHEGHGHEDHGGVPTGHSPWERLFHLFHPMHILLSAAATTAMFWRYDRRLLVAFFAGFVGSVGFCGLSDIVFPWAGGWFLGAPMDLHICLIEHPGLIIPFAFIGIFAGLVAADAYSDHRISVFSHSAHVLISTGATLLFLVGFGFTDWSYRLTEIFVIVFVAVIVPCCASDIFFPLLLVNPAGAHFCNGHCRDDVSAPGNDAGKVA